MLVTLRILKLHYLFDFWLWFARIEFDLIRGKLVVFWVLRGCSDGFCGVFVGFLYKIKSEIVIRDRTDNKNSISTIKLNNLLTTNPNQLENRLFCIPNQKTLSKIKYKAAVSLQRLT